MTSKMKQFIRVCSSVLLSSITMHLFKIANEEDEHRHTVPMFAKENNVSPLMDVSPTGAGLKPTYDIGSELISTALQHIFSSDSIVENPPELTHDINAFFNPDYALGSESLNRMLEEMLSANFNENAKVPYIAPAQEL